ncbi:hypothetical protein PoB_001039900 [Plakobranchus ocellatus]|uniref:Uncharacterized protein n=1 Tax=Plakobranchus ocellatus TaxID=259542 RepID=A0AAV3YLH8_9GAST|nr:hypothetical protein PoB_001039900 [Plakobranchus ocellatus]
MKYNIFKSEEDIFRSHSRDTLGRNYKPCMASCLRNKVRQQAPKLTGSHSSRNMLQGRMEYLIYCTKDAPTFSRSYTKYYEVHGKTSRSVKSG